MASVLREKFRDGYSYIYGGVVSTDFLLGNREANFLFSMERRPTHTEVGPYGAGYCVEVG